MKKKKRRIFTQLADRHRGTGTAPRCRHFNQCGGCMFQDIPYESQLLLKRDYINDTMSGRACVDSVHPSTPYGYRTRMDMVTAFGKFGLRRAGSYRTVVDIDSCPIMQEKSDHLFGTIKPLISGIEDYDYLKHQGYLRYAVFRQAHYSGQTMLNFVLATRDNRLGTVIESIIDKVDSISLILSDGLADLSFGEIIETVKGGHIEEHFDDITYRITPNSFFQSNAAIARKMYERIREETKGKVLDLYSGIGSISLYIAGSAEEVTGIELEEEAVAVARHNKDINGIDNVQFQCCDAKDFIKDNDGLWDTLILDPPRSGMHPKMLKHISGMKIGTIIYMSCNPAAFRDDLEGLQNFRIDTFEAFDMFPQTPHVETLAVLKRR